MTTCSAVCVPVEGDCHSSTLGFIKHMMFGWLLENTGNTDEGVHTFQEPFICLNIYEYMGQYVLFS